MRKKQVRTYAVRHLAYIPRPIRSSHIQERALVHSLHSVLAHVHARNHIAKLSIVNLTEIDQRLDHSRDALDKHPLLIACEREGDIDRRLVPRCADNLPRLPPRIGILIPSDELNDPRAREFVSDLFADDRTREFAQCPSLLAVDKP